MDFGGVVGLDGFVGAFSGNGCGGGGLNSSSSLLNPSDPDPSRQSGLFGSSQFKHGRSGGPEEHEWGSLKLARSDALFSASNRADSSILRSHPHSFFPNGEQMLSFSSSSSSSTTDAAFPYYHHPSSSSSYGRNAVSGSPDGSMHGILTGVRGGFTPSQWMELKQQALIYSYIDANMPIPSSLLISIRRDLNSSGFSAYSAGSFRTSHTLGWGSFHLGFSGNADPEPGRCRRTDGKKWRCSRDAVSDQKYCERHMNRGRHRSRKHVEAQSGHAAKAIPVIPPSQSTSAVSGGISTTNSLNIARQQMKSLQPNVTDSSSTQYNRMPESKENANDCVCDSQGSMLTVVNPKPINTLFPISKQHNAFEGTSGTDFGLISADSLLNLHSESISFAREPHPRPLRHFIDDWPKDQSDRSTITWPEEMQSDQTQLSISIPISTSDFSSSSSSPNQEKVSLSPLRLSKELDPIHMCLGVGGVVNEVNPRQASWLPISWETSLGGPLGEVLANSNSTPRDNGKNCSLASSLNLLTDGWDSSSQLQSSPTDVQQNTTFGSLSSSTGSSPRAENQKAHDSTSSLCEDLLGSTFVNPSRLSPYYKLLTERHQQEQE